MHKGDEVICLTPPDERLSVNELYTVTDVFVDNDEGDICYIAVSKYPSILWKVEWFRKID